MSDNSVVQSNDIKKNVKILDYPLPNHGGISRERSFVRPSNPQNQMNINKRRSLGFQQQQQMRIKPAMEIYRPPNVRGELPLNVNAQEFQMNRNNELQLNSRFQFDYLAGLNQLHHSKSSASNMQAQIQQHQLQQHNRLILQQNILQQQQNLAQQRILLSHPMQMAGITLHQSSHLPLVNSPSSGNILHQSSPRVKFAPEPIIHLSQKNHYQPLESNNNGFPVTLQRSKSLSSADALTRGITNLGLGGVSTEDIGAFPADITAAIAKASEDPNQLTARCLMELATHCMNRAIEGRRYALPISRLCIAIISKEQKETFLEALLNTCRQWYQERDKVLGMLPNSKNPSRPRFTAFMAFLTEMFCQMKRRQLQLRTQCDGISPALVILTLLAKSCEDCVKAPVRSLSEIECLFFVLTCIGRELEIHLPQQLDNLLSGVRDAFLNSSASAPAIRRTLLQLIELQASKWQLPCNTISYYYPNK